MIYVCIPAHDESSTIGVLLWKVRKVLGEFGRDYRIVVHDDASSDDTVAVLERYRRALPLTILRSDEQQGYGRSVERLLRHVAEESPYPKRDCAVVMQGDFTDDPEDMVSLIKVFEGGADIVAGHEELTGTEVPDAARWTRRLASVFLRRLVKTAPVSDPFSGMRAYRIIVLKKAFRDLGEHEFLTSADGWAANVELLAHLVPHARRVAESELRPRYALRQRPSRFKTWPTFKSLLKVRNAEWPSAPSEVA